MITQLIHNIDTIKMTATSLSKTDGTNVSWVEVTIGDLETTAFFNSFELLAAFCSPRSIRIEMLSE